MGDTRGRANNELHLIRAVREGVYEKILSSVPSSRMTNVLVNILKRINKVDGLFWMELLTCNQLLDIYVILRGHSFLNRRNV